MNYIQPNKSLKNNRFSITIVTVVLAIAIMLLNPTAAIAETVNSNTQVTEEICSAPASEYETNLRKVLGDDYDNLLLTYEGCPEEMGAWYMLPIPKEKREQMQAVHAVLLPSNKVLIANGSSNRNTLTAEGKIEDGVDVKNYDVVDNTTIFDPSLSDPFYKGENIQPDFTKNPFTKINSPIDPVPDLTTGKDEANDLFCSGHLHLPDGNIIFAGGTRAYYPGVQFLGGKIANLFDWTTEAWNSPPHILEDGRWYPTLVPLHNGAIAIFSGLKASEQLAVSPLVEIYDPNQTGSENEWQALDISQLKDSPFNTQMNDLTNTPDYLDLYPRIFPVKNANEDKFLITGDGGGKTPLAAHTSRHSYFITFHQDDDGKYSAEFELGPDRQATSKVYGTASLDPSSPNGDVLLYGGIIGTNDISFGPGKYAIDGASIAASVERWQAPENIDDCEENNPDYCQGSWEIYPDFLARIDENIIQGTRLDSYPAEYEYTKTSAYLGSYGTRAMSLAVTLPTKQILMVSGGIYAEHRPVFNPTLLTPDEAKEGGFSTKKMNPDDEARLYHNTSLLLPDGRVLVMGGNPSRAARKKDGTVLTNTIRDFELAPNGSYFLPAEVYRHAIFYPPYLFTPGLRPEIKSIADSENEIPELHYGQSLNIEVENVSENVGKEDDRGNFRLVKLGSVTHSFDMGQRLEDVNIESSGYIVNQNESYGSFNVKMPENRYFLTPGYYMIFYVNDLDKPSHAQIIHLS